MQSVILTRRAVCIRSEAVYPLLKCGGVALPDVDWPCAAQLHQGIEHPVIDFDALLDRTLLPRALNEFRRLDEEPIEFKRRLISLRDVLDRLED